MVYASMYTVQLNCTKSKSLDQTESCVLARAEEDERGQRCGAGAYAMRSVDEVGALLALQRVVTSLSTSICERGALTGNKVAGV